MAPTPALPSTGCVTKRPNLRIRPVPEMNTCVVFNPADAALRTVTPAAWLLLELCDGRSPAALRDAYVDAVAPGRGNAEAARWFRKSYALLREHGLIDVSDAATAARAQGA